MSEFRTLRAVEDGEIVEGMGVTNVYVYRSMYINRNGEWEWNGRQEKEEQTKGKQKELSYMKRGTRFIYRESSNLPFTAQSKK